MQIVFFGYIRGGCNAGRQKEKRKNGLSGLQLF